MLLRHKYKFAVLLILIVVIYTNVFSFPQRYKGPVSDHFDGQRFYNEVPFKQTTFTYYQMRLTEPFSPWPKWIETQTGPTPKERLEVGEVSIVVVNHAMVLIQIGSLNILTDPILSHRCSPVSWAGPERVCDPGLTFDQLPPIDYVLISHDHYDHLDLPTLKKIDQRDQPKILAGLGVEKILEKENLSCEPLDWWDEYVVGNALKIIFVPAQHFSGRWLNDQFATLWGGFALVVNSKAIYFAGDTGYSPHFKEIKERLGPIRVALLPIGAYLPRWFMGVVHLSPVEAVQAHMDLESEVSIGMHYGTFQFTGEGYNQPIEDLELALDQKGISRRSFLTLPFGQAYQIRH